MARYRLWKRKTTKNGRNIYYYRLPSMKSWKSTGISAKKRAEEYVEALLDGPKRIGPDVTFKEYTATYFTDRCPHCTRLESEGKHISREYRRYNRMLLDKYVNDDTLATILFWQIRRGDLIDFRDNRLKEKAPGLRTVNTVMQAVKIIFNEAVYREELSASPAAMIGKLKYEVQKPGSFTSEELKLLFPGNHDESPWRDIYEYCAFLIAAACGMRRSEILALRWQNVYFDEGRINVCEAFKGNDSRVELPKGQKTRNTPLSEKVKGALIILQEESIRTVPQDYLFSYDDGTPRGSTWWSKSFIRCMRKVGFDRKGRNLKPHSFRGSLNNILLSKGHSAELIRLSFGWSGEEVQKGYTTAQSDILREQGKLIDDIFSSDR